jgi:hypothetical protein
MPPIQKVNPSRLPWEWCLGHTWISLCSQGFRVYLVLNTGDQGPELVNFAVGGLDACH